MGADAGPGPPADAGQDPDRGPDRGPDRAPDRDLAPQWALPLVVRIERADPPARTDALEAAAQAVLALLTDPRAAAGGEWAAAVAGWTDSRIRKVVRRARGAEWRRAAALPGIDVRRGSAQVRVFPPVPLDGWPPDLARLQVSGTDLADPAPPPPPAPDLPVLWLAPGQPLTAGKAMAQAGHAAQLAWLALAEPARAAWRAAGHDLAVRTADPARWARLRTARLPSVRDAGFTEVAPGTVTVVADHPALRPASAGPARRPRWWRRQR